MIEKANPGKKVLLLISDAGLRNWIKPELEKCNFDVEEFICTIHQCQVVVLDYFYFQFGIAEYLSEKEIKKPIFLVLNQHQIHSGDIRLNGLLRDILVTCDNDSWESKNVISALRGEVEFRSIFEDKSLLNRGFKRKKEQWNQRRERAVAER